MTKKKISVSQLHFDSISPKSESTSCTISIKTHPIQITIWLRYYLKKYLGN